jgi:hypothetical protein
MQSVSVAVVVKQIQRDRNDGSVEDRTASILGRPSGYTISPGGSILALVIHPRRMELPAKVEYRIDASSFRGGGAWIQAHVTARLQLGKRRTRVSEVPRDVLGLHILCETAPQQGTRKQHNHRQRSNVLPFEHLKSPTELAPLEMHEF